MASKIFWTQWVIQGLAWETWAILWGRTQWTLSYHVALLRDKPIFWVIMAAWLWAAYHFFRDEIGGIKGVF